MGPFTGYKENEQPFLRVMEKHRAAADLIPDDLVQNDRSPPRAERGEAVEMAGCMATRTRRTVLAPTGTTRS
jgi:hypothetical protein